jgi:hypothetical protein
MLCAFLETSRSHLAESKRVSCARRRTNKLKELI